jgi:predicted nicotinamide N-methyase
VRLHLAREVLPIWEAAERTEEAGPLSPPFWAFAWAGGQGLSRYVLDHPELLRHQHVLDFASGCGVSAIAAARCGARVTASEIDPWALVAVAENARLNGVAVALAGDVVGTAGDWTTVLAGDVCYQEQASARIVSWLRTLAARGTRVLLGDPGRAFFPRQGIRQLARYRVPTTRDLEGVTERDTGVFELLPD